MTYVKQVEGVDTRLTLLWFLEADPRECWEDRFTGLDEAVAESGSGRVELVAPFIPDGAGYRPVRRPATLRAGSLWGRAGPVSRALSARTAGQSRGLCRWCS